MRLELIGQQIEVGHLSHSVGGACQCNEHHDTDVFGREAGPR
jgi:hypothetical protein